MVKYIVIEHDYKTKVTKQIFESYSLHNCVCELDSRTQSIMTEKEGNRFEMLPHHRFSPASRWWNNVRYGFHLVGNAKVSIYQRYIVQKRYINNFFSTYEIQPFYYYDIVRVDVERPAYVRPYFSETLETEEGEAMCRYFNKYDKVLDELLLQVVQRKGSRFISSKLQYDKCMKELLRKKGPQSINYEVLYDKCMKELLLMMKH